MAAPDIKCDLCGQPLQEPRMMNEMYLLKPGEKKIGPQLHQRMFDGRCLAHGHRIVGFASEGHSTLLESRLKQLFTKAERKVLRLALLPDERRNFRDALIGQYAWDKDDVSRWKAIVAEISDAN